MDDFDTELINGINGIVVIETAFAHDLELINERHKLVEKFVDAIKSNNIDRLNSVIQIVELLAYHITTILESAAASNMVMFNRVLEIFPLDSIYSTDLILLIKYTIKHNDIEKLAIIIGNFNVIAGCYHYLTELIQYAIRIVAKNNNLKILRTIFDVIILGNIINNNLFGLINTAIKSGNDDILEVFLLALGCKIKIHDHEWDTILLNTNKNRNSKSLNKILSNFGAQVPIRVIDYLLRLATSLLNDVNNIDILDQIVNLARDKCYNSITLDLLNRMTDAIINVENLPKYILLKTGKKLRCNNIADQSMNVLNNILGLVDNNNIIDSIFYIKICNFLLVSEVIVVDYIKTSSKLYCISIEIKYKNILNFLKKYSYFDPELFGNVSKIVNKCNLELFPNELKEEISEYITPHPRYTPIRSDQVV